MGKPNVGKSTLLNRLVGQQISITANKPQTTRNNIRGIVTRENFQAIILDTPGVHLPRNELHLRIVNYATRTVKGSDLIFFLTEPVRPFQKAVSEEDRLVLNYLQGDFGKAILVINKTDLCGGEQILKTIEIFNRTFPFAETVPICALKGRGVDILTGFFPKYLPEGIAYYPKNCSTDTPERVIVGEFVREQLMRLCFREVPYGTAVLVEKFEEKKKIINIYATIHIVKKSHKKIVIGKKGAMLKRVGENSRIKMERLLGRKVFLSLHVKISKNWLDNPQKLNEFGYGRL